MAIFQAIFQGLSDMFTDQIKPLFLQVSDRYVDLVTAPAKNTDMIWIIFPVVAMLILMEFYFGRYSKEKLGWNSAVANSIVLIFVSIDLFRQIYQGDFSMFFEANPSASIQITTTIATVIAILGVWLLMVDFYHLLPENLAYRISSHLPINLIAYLSIILVYTNLSHGDETIKAIPLDIYTFTAAILLFFTLFLIFWAIRILEPKEDDPKPSEEEKKENASESLFVDV